MSQKNINQTILAFAHQQLLDEQQLKERMQLLTVIEDQMQELIWDYSPDITIRHYDMKYSYGVLPTGVTQIPSVFMSTTSGTIELFVRGEAVPAKPYHGPPGSTYFSCLTLVGQLIDEEQTLIFAFDEDGKVPTQAIPSLEELQQAASLLGFMINEHRRIGTKMAPQGHADSDWL